LEALGYIGQAVGGLLDLMMLIGRADQQLDLYKASKNTQSRYIYPEDGSCSVYRTLDGFQRSILLIPAT
jgi:hypothetical protein